MADISVKGRAVLKITIKYLVFLVECIYQADCIFHGGIL
jgi:hypothetical protein